MRRSYRHGLLVAARRSPHHATAASFGTTLPLLRRRPRPRSPPRRLSSGAAPPAVAATVCIGLGTNTGARLESLLDAVDAVRALPTTWLEDTSMLYEVSVRGGGVWCTVLADVGALRQRRRRCRGADEEGHRRSE